MTTSTRPKRVWLAHIMGAIVLALLVTTVVDGALEGGSAKPISVPFSVMLVVFVGVGWLLAARLPRNPLGWLLIAVVGIFAAQVPALLLGQALQNVAPDAAAWLYWFGFDREVSWAWLPPVGLLFTQIPLRFPDGELLSRGWRWFSWFTVGALVISSVLFSTISVEVAPGVPNPIHVPGAETPEWLGLIAFVVFGSLFVSIAGSLASLFVRYRRAGSLQRAQLRWVLWAVGIVFAALILSQPWVPPSELTFVQSLVQNLVYLSYVLIPLAILVAVLRYRLYEIDRIISRTVSYALVSLFVIVVYLLVVTSVHWIFPDLQEVGVALATLAAAALFLPVLRWVRRLVDRRFDRERYDAEKVVDAFGEQLRTDLDPNSTADELIEAIEKALQPASVGLWTIKEGTK